MSNSRTGARISPDESGGPCNVRKLGDAENQNKHTQYCGYVRGRQDPAGRAPSGQSCNKLSSKINEVVLGYNPNLK